MLKQALIYTNPDLYSYGQLDLVHQRFFTSTPDAEADISYYLEKYREKFADKKYSELHILILHLDPANGVTEVLTNEYGQNPLKIKTIINAAAANAPKVKKMSQHFLMDTPPSSIAFDEEPDEDNE